MVVPKFDHDDVIQNFRQKYDPLFCKVGYHIELVFPFETDIPLIKIEEHVRHCVAEIKSFEIAVSEPCGFDDEFIFLSIKEGNDSLINLHDALYKGLLSTFLNRHFFFMPHITIGRLKSKSEFEMALQESKIISGIFKATIKEIIIEKILDDESSEIVSKISLPL